MDYDDFEIGDRVGRFIGDDIEKATIIDIIDGLYLLKFDNSDYYNLLCDEEKIFKLNEGE